MVGRLNLAGGWRSSLQQPRHSSLPVLRSCGSNRRLTPGGRTLPRWTRKCLKSLARPRWTRKCLKSLARELQHCRKGHRGDGGYHDCRGDPAAELQRLSNREIAHGAGLSCGRGPGATFGQRADGIGGGVPPARVWRAARCRSCQSRIRKANLPAIGRSASAPVRPRGMRPCPQVPPWLRCAFLHSASAPALTPSAN